MAKLEKIKEDIQKERYKLQATKVEKQRNDRQFARFELFYENIKDCIKSLPCPIFNEIKIANNKKEYILGISDIHYAANYISTNNQYNRDIVKERFEILLTEVKDYVTKNNITKLKVLNGADDIAGILRIKDLQLNEISVVDAVVEIAQLIATFLNKLSQCCEIEYYHTGYANHSQTRPLGTQASVLASEDMGKIIGHYIKDLLRDNERISVIFDSSKDYVDFKIFNFDCILMHGHQIKNYKYSLKDLSDLHNKMYSYVFLGHLHSGTEIIVGEEKHNNKEVIVIPSFCGSDIYSDSLFVGSKAMAKIYEFDHSYGHTGTKNIILN